VISIFRDKSIIAIFGLIVCTLLIHLHIFTVPVIIKADADTGLFSWILKNYITRLQPFAINAIYIGLLLVQSIRLNIVLNDSKMFNKSGFTTGFAYILLSGMLINAYALTPALLTTSLIILVIKNAFSLYNNPSAKGLIFNIGFISTLSFICYQPSVLLLVAVMFALGILRAFRPAEWLILVFGMVAPAYLLLSGLFLSDKMNLLPMLLPKIHFTISITKEPWYWFNVSTIAVLVFAGLILWYPNSNRMVIQTRKNWVVMLVLSLLLLLGLFAFNAYNQFPEILCLIPMAAFVSNYFLYTRRSILANLLVLVSAATIVHNHLQLMK
jgi:hypothetical protein